jgi:hypothetical protein
MRKNTIFDVLCRLVICEPSTLPTGCWIWPGAKTGDGYGNVGWQCGRVKVHSLVYEHFVGPVPDGLELDHLCRNRDCANFEHLEAVTHQVNCQRGLNRQREKTHCPRGHVYSGYNLSIKKTGSRRCKNCERDRAREAYRAKNPDHLPANRDRTHCQRGHPYSGENLYVKPDGERCCRTCQRDRMSVKRARLRDERAADQIYPDTAN